jgi:DNA-binding transcriptional LysR family regulator
MQIESLKVFCDLVDTGSFTRSAAINDVTQSAVSQQINALERAFKTPLLDRNQGKGKSFRLTRKGQMLYDNSKKIIAIYSSLLQQIDDSPTEASPMNRMTATSGGFSHGSARLALQNDADPADVKI